MKELATLNVKDSRRRQRSLKTDRNSKLTILPLLTFFATFFLMLFVLMYNNMAPFGEHSLLVSDLRSQYAPYLVRFKTHLLHLDIHDLISTFSYDNTLGGGKNFMSTFGYYMASPLNILVLIFPANMINIAVTLLCTIRLSLGACFMCIFLQKRSTDKNSNWPMLFAITYAFTSYSVIFLFNILWFDAYMLLPLLLYFIELYIGENKKTGIAVTLIILFISNFYASYMVGIFSFFYLAGRLIYISVIENGIDVKGIIRKCLKFILLAVLSILASCAVIIPVVLDVLRNRDVLKEKAKTDFIQFKGIDILDQIFFGNVGEFETLGSNLPYIFVSLTVTMLILLFFISKVFEKKEKIFYGTVFLLMFISFNVTLIDKMWQAFDTPNWFCHRYSFVFIPVMLVLTLKVFEKIKEIPNKDILKTYVIMILLLFVTQSFGKISENEWFFILNVGLMTGYALVFMALKRTKWPEQLKNMQKISAFLLALFVLFETAGMAPRTAEGLTPFANGLPDLEYQRDILQAMEMGQYAATYNDGARVGAEECAWQDEDLWVDSAFEIETVTGLNGVSSFDSSCNRKYARFMKQLGIMTNFNYAAYNYTYASMPTDAFLSVGNVISTADYRNADLVSSDSKDYFYRSYKNRNVLPIGFAVDKGAMDYEFYMLEKISYNKDYFAFQNKWYKSMFPENFTGDIYEGIYQVKDEDLTVYNACKMPVDNADISSSGSDRYEDPLGLENQSKSVQDRNTYYRQSTSAPIAITVRYKVTKTGEQYFCLSSNTLQSGNKIYINKELINAVYPDSYFTTITRLGYYEEGQEIVMTIACERATFAYLDMYFAAVDPDNFSSMFGTLDQSKVTVDRYDNGIASFTTDLGEKDLLLTTIPYEKGWTCYVDGKKTDMLIYQDALIAVDPGTGNHKVELRFEAPGIKAGIAVSAVGIVLLAAYIFLDSRKDTKIKTESKAQ